MSDKGGLGATVETPSVHWPEAGPREPEPVHDHSEDPPIVGFGLDQWVEDPWSGWRGETHDAVNHPLHYCDIVPGIECIDVTEHFSFLRGNAIKYLWRAGAKGDTVEDLRKAIFYIDREITNLEG